MQRGQLRHILHDSCTQRVWLNTLTEADLSSAAGEADVVPDTCAREINVIFICSDYILRLIDTHPFIQFARLRFALFFRRPAHWWLGFRIIMRLDDKWAKTQSELIRGERERGKMPGLY